MSDGLPLSEAALRRRRRQRRRAAACAFVQAGGGSGGRSLGVQDSQTRTHVPGESGGMGFGRQEPLLAQVVVALRCLAAALEVQQGGFAHLLLEASPAKVESAEVPQVGSADQMPLARGYASPRDPLSEMGCLYFQREDCNQQWWDPFNSVPQPSGVPFFCDRGCVPEQFYFDKASEPGCHTGTVAGDCLYLARLMLFLWRSISRSHRRLVALVAVQLNRRSSRWNPSQAPLPLAR